MISSPPSALVIGAAGQVGGALVELLGDERVAASQRRDDREAGYFDLATAGSHIPALRKLMEAREVSVVFIAAGMAWVDGCERDEAGAFAVNRDGPAAVAEAARAFGARTVYYSTEYVFDGRAGPYREESSPNPVSVYGKSKLAGEQAVLAVDPEALVLRTTVVYGPEEEGKNFAYQLADRLARGEKLMVPEDQISSPTYNRDLAVLSIALVRAGARGIYNVVGPETMDRVQFARRLARAAGLETDGIQPVATVALGQAAARPLRAGLTIDKMLRTLPVDERRGGPRTVEDAVAHWRLNPRGKPWPR